MQWFNANLINTRFFSQCKTENITNFVSLNIWYVFYLLLCIKYVFISSHCVLVYNLTVSQLHCNWGHKSFQTREFPDKIVIMAIKIMFFCFLFSNFVHCLKLILIHHHTRASYRKIPPWHDLVLHQNLTNSTSLLFVNKTDQWCMKLESSQLHAMTRVWAKSDPLSTSGCLCPGCCHHISHWELLKIHSSSSTLQHHHLHLIFLVFFYFFYLLLVLVCHLLYYCMLSWKYKQGKSI